MCTHPPRPVQPSLQDFFKAFIVSVAVLVSKSAESAHEQKRSKMSFPASMALFAAGYSFALLSLGAGGKLARAFALRRAFAFNRASELSFQLSTLSFPSSYPSPQRPPHRCWSVPPCATFPAAGLDSQELKTNEGFRIPVLRLQGSPRRFQDGSRQPKPPPRRSAIGHQLSTINN